MHRPLSIILLAWALAAGCSRKAQTVEAPPPTSTDMRTIDSANLRPAPIEAPPVLTDEAPPLKQLNIVAQTDAPPPPTPQDEALRASLPFAPAIAMDPVDGSKISIRVSIPTLEYKNKLYYFATDEHKRAFLANPEQYTKGVFSHL
ncbi:MAG TPA: YHS domain-containing protein [Thermoanaerobaculia bacterium]|jgi:YHS domain-containing protein|nr:YHS domain-containing protein [Thermoanaerobaculia bacterium]